MHVSRGLQYAFGCLIYEVVHIGTTPADDPGLALDPADFGTHNSSGGEYVPMPAAALRQFAQNAAPVAASSEPAAASVASGGMLAPEPRQSVHGYGDSVIFGSNALVGVVKARLCRCEPKPYMT